MYDISSPTPALLASYDPPAPVVAFEGGVRAGGSLYVAAHQEGVYVLDIGPGLSFDSQIALSESAAWDIALHTDHLLVANGRHGLSIVDISGAPIEIATLALPGLANDIEVKNSTAYLTLAAHGVAAVDISNPANPPTASPIRSPPIRRTSSSMPTASFAIGLGNTIPST